MIRKWLRFWIGILTATAGWIGLAAGPLPGSLPNPFFAMDTGTRDAAHATIASQVQMIKDLGFAGFGPAYNNPEGFREIQSALDRQGLKMFALFSGLNIDGGKAAVTPQLKEAIQLLKGRQTLLWLPVQSGQYKPSATEGDAKAVAALVELARVARVARVRIALYPHAGFWVERVEDAVRLAAKVDRKNLGVTFNLCHWLKVDGRDLEASLTQARPYLFVVTINGADTDGKDWFHLIQPLDKGTFDVSRVLSLLMKLGYTGPIGLQHYGIGGNAEENLKHSMDAWRRLSARAVAEAAKH